MKFRSLILIFSLFLLLFGRSAYACSYLPAPSSVTFTADMEHVFVMLRDEKAGLGDAYRTSGLYRLDGSRDPLWAIDWISDSVFVHSDAKSLVQLDERAEAEPPSSEVLHLSKRERIRYDNPDQWIENHVKDLRAISFYAAGELIHDCLLYTSPSPRDATLSRMPSSA